MTEPVPTEPRDPAEMPELDAPLHLPSAREAARRYDRLTDAEVPPEFDGAFTRSYTFAAHRSARHLSALIAEVSRLTSALSTAEQERDQLQQQVWALEQAHVMSVEVGRQAAEAELERCYKHQGDP